MGYTKLFSEIVMSTVWREKDTTRLVWITMLALRNRHHIVEGSVPGLADCARVSIEACRAALRVLSGPDPDSRSQEFEGRRIQSVDGGWWIVNGEKYRRKMSQDERREKNAIYQKQHRERKKAVSTPVDISAMSAQTEEETETKKKIDRTLARPTIEQVIELIGETAGRDFFDYYESNGWRVGRNPMKSWKAAAQRWKRNQSTVNPARPNFSRQKERAPSYPKMSETRECSDEERERVLAIAAEEKEKLRFKLNDHS